MRKSSRKKSPSKKKSSRVGAARSGKKKPRVFKKDQTALRRRDALFSSGSRTSSRKGVDLDILDALKKDHDVLKECIETMKDEHASGSEIQDAFENFKSLLQSHAESEESAVYDLCKEKDELRTEAFEGYEEHAIASEMLEKIESSREDDQWRARVKIAAELVEHHIEEEEKVLFKGIRQEFSPDEREEMCRQFIELREGSQPDRTSENEGVLASL